MREDLAGPVTATFERRLRANARYASEKRLQRFGWSAFSSSDQDGIIAEIFARIGTSTRRFLELGVSPQRGSCTAYLLASGWSGTWIAPDAPSIDSLTKEFGSAMRDGRLRIECSPIANADSGRLSLDIETAAGIDLLRVDAAGNEYHVLEPLAALPARVVIVRYNAFFRPPIRWIASYQGYRSDRAQDFGASLSAIETLMRSKGFALVGCNLAGSDAFFVRRDLTATYFEQPFSAENHYEPERSYLAAGLPTLTGLRHRFGPADVHVPESTAGAPNELIHRATGQFNRAAFDESSLSSVADIEAAIRRAPPPREVRSVLDFGCGCGRIARTLVPRFRGARFVGADIDKEAISWAQRHIAPATFVANDHLPPLPFDEETFDLVYGWSVFTHLDEAFQDAWLAELRRVTVRGGTVLLTVSGRANWNWIAGHSTHPRRKELLALREHWLRDGILYWTGDGWEEFLPDFYHTTFHTPRYVEKHWSRWFDVVSIVPGGAGRIQDMITLRRPD